MNSRSLITLAVAVVIGLGAMKLSQQMLSSNKNKAGDDTQEVLVAARDFKEEEILKADMVKVIRMVRSAVPPNAFSTFKDVEDRWVRTDDARRRRARREEAGPQGNSSGIGREHPRGNEGAGDRRDRAIGRLGVHPPRPPRRPGSLRELREKRHTGETILQDVLVLAAGQIFSRPEERAVQSRTVTLALAPGDVDILVAARARGALSLSLRGVNDHSLVESPKAEPMVDPEAENRLKLADLARQKAENDLQALKEQLARTASPRLPNRNRLRERPRFIGGRSRVLRYPTSTRLEPLNWPRAEPRFRNLRRSESLGLSPETEP